MDLNSLLSGANIVFLVPIVGLLGWVATEVMKHRERMAMIEKGINPYLQSGDAADKEEASRRLETRR